MNQYIPIFALMKYTENIKQKVRDYIQNTPNDMLLQKLESYGFELEQVSVSDSGMPEVSIPQHSEK